jgi:hypothetical protein
MSYLNEMVARGIAEERQRDALMSLRQRDVAQRRTQTVAAAVPARHHGRWHDALVRLHVLHIPTP